MNTLKRKKLYRINMSTKNVSDTVAEVAPKVEQPVAEVEKQLPVALKDEPVVVVEVVEAVEMPVAEVVVTEEVQEEVITDTEENKEVKKNVLPKFKKFKKDVEVGE